MNPGEHLNNTKSQIIDNSQDTTIVESTKTLDQTQDNIPSTPILSKRLNKTQIVMIESQDALTRHIGNSGNRPNGITTARTGINTSNEDVLNRPQSLYSLKPIQRRGNTYMIKEPAEFNNSDINSTDSMINDLYNETLNMSAVSNTRAELFKYLTDLSTVFMILAGVAIGILTQKGYHNDTTLYIASGLGFLITGIQTILSTFSIGKRSVLLKNIAGRLRKTSRQIKSLEVAIISPEEKMRKLEEFYAEVDEFDLDIFDNNITTVSVSNSTHIAKPSGKENSDLNSDPDKDGLYEDLGNKKMNITKAKNAAARHNQAMGPSIEKRQGILQAMVVQSGDNIV